MNDLRENLTPEGIEARARSRTRRRLIAWGGLLVLGLALGAIYATGFATTGNAPTATGDAALNHNSAGPDADDSALAARIDQPDSQLAYTFAGRWGSVGSAALYELDLESTVNGDTPDGDDKFFAEVVLVDTPSGFSDLQLQFRIADVSGGGTCDAAAIEAVPDTPNHDDHRVMIFDTDDAQVTFSGIGGVGGGLPGDATYCIGISDYSANLPAHQASGKDILGTFIRRAQATTTVSEPTFVGTLNRMAP